MKQIIRLKESDLRKLVMEASARLLNPDYSWDEFDQNAFDAEGDEKQSQIDASWDALNDKSLSNPSFDENNNIYDRGLSGHYSLLSQGYDNIDKNNANPDDIMRAQTFRGNATDSVDAARESWWGAPNDEDFSDGMPPIIGYNANYNGKFSNRNPYSGEYYSDPRHSNPLSEAINRAVRKTIKKHVR